MARTDALSGINTRQTAQTAKADPRQVKNNAGGYTFTVSRLDALKRFLILGTEGGTYYVDQKTLTEANAAVVIEFANADPRLLVDTIVDISQGGRAPKNDPALFALAIAASAPVNAADRSYALSKLPLVARTGTHLFHFAGYVEQFRGWGRSLRKAVGGWYEDKPADRLALQLVKYRQRDGWSHRDLLRLAHPSGVDTAHKALYTWTTDGNVGHTSTALPDLIHDFHDAQDSTTPVEWVEIVARGNGLTWEMLPDEARKSPDVWRALIELGMPQTALMRQLPTLTRLGVLQGATLGKVASQLADQDRLTAGRVHPFNVLVAQRTYARGQSLRGSSTWTPNRKIVDALDAAFYASFGNVEPANKRTLIALDVSGSMGMDMTGGGWGYYGAAPKVPLTARDASAAMSLITMATEPDTDVVAFTGGGSGWGYSRRSRVSQTSPLTELSISPRQRLDDVIRNISDLPFGTTDCSLPMTWAAQQKREYDTMIVFTDNETYAGNIHPHQALKRYRDQTGINTKLIVAGMTATDFTIADPRDKGMLDVVGLDSSLPNIISDFSADRF